MQTLAVPARGSIPGYPIEAASSGIKERQYFALGVAGNHREPIAQYMFIAVASHPVPSNPSANAHGNGYVDPNIFVPELLESVQIDGGAYNASLKTKFYILVQRIRLALVNERSFIWMATSLRGAQWPASGVGVLLSLVLYLSVDVAVNWLLYQVGSLQVVQPVPVRIALVREGAELAIILASTWAVARVTRRWFGSYGYAARDAGTRQWTGVIWGFGSLTALIFCMWSTGHLIFDGLQLRGRDALAHTLAWGVVFLMVGILEESLFRGFLQHTLAKGLGFWWAAMIVSGAFMLWHLHSVHESLVGLLSTGAGSLLFCPSLWYTRSLWWAVGFHTGRDWGQSFFYGTPDSGILVQGSLLRQRPQGNPLWSGGAVGPEGSLFMFPLVCLLCLGMWIWWSKNPFGRLDWFATDYSFAE